MTWISSAGWGYPIQTGRTVDRKNGLRGLPDGGFNALLVELGIPFSKRIPIEDAGLKGVFRGSIS